MADLGRYQRKDHLLVEQVEGELVMLDIEGGHYYGLNPVGALVWEELVEPRTVAELVEGITARFEVEGPQAEEDLRALLADLVGRGLAAQVGPVAGGGEPS